MAPLSSISLPLCLSFVGLSHSHLLPPLTPALFTLAATLAAGADNNFAAFLPHAVVFFSSFLPRTLSFLLSPDDEDTLGSLQEHSRQTEQRTNGRRRGGAYDRRHRNVLFVFRRASERASVRAAASKASGELNPLAQVWFCDARVRGMKLSARRTLGTRACVPGVRPIFEVRR